MFRQVTTVLLLVVLTRSVSPIGAAQRQLANEEYAVYIFLLTELWAPERRAGLVVQRETTDDASRTSDDFDRTSELLTQEFVDTESSGPLPDELIQSFGRLRRSNVRMDPKRLGVPRVTLVPSKEIDSIFEDPRDPWDGWGKLRERFDGARSIIRFSRVAFSADGTRAMVAVSHWCGFLCGSGKYLLLGKAEGEWLVLASHMTWVS